jgi:lysophosphatidic acid acyltransferase/lysophosphatidylinositol acyltransferase
LLDKHVAEDTFSDQELQDARRPIKSLVVRYFLNISNSFSFLFISYTFSLHLLLYRCFSNGPSISCGEQVALSWAFVVVAGSVKFLQWSSLLASWKGVAFSTFGLAVVTGLMHILILFSQAERSNPAKVAPAKPKNKEEQPLATNDKQQ